MRFLVVALIGVLFSGAGRCDIASITYVTKQTENQVRTSGDQEIAGTKTYTASPIVPTPDLPQ